MAIDLASSSKSTQNIQSPPTQERKKIEAPREKEPAREARPKEETDQSTSNNSASNPNDSGENLSVRA